MLGSRPESERDVLPPIEQRVVGGRVLQADASHLRKGEQRGKVRGLANGPVLLRSFGAVAHTLLRRRRSPFDLYPVGVHTNAYQLAAPLVGARIFEAVLGGVRLGGR